MWIVSKVGNNDNNNNNLAYLCIAAFLLFGEWFVLSFMFIVSTLTGISFAVLCCSVVIG